MRFFIFISLLLHGALLYYVSDITLLPQQHLAGNSGGPIQIALTTPVAESDTATELRAEKSSAAPQPQNSADTTAASTPVVQQAIVPSPVAAEESVAEQQPASVVTTETAVANSMDHTAAQLANEAIVAEKIVADPATENGSPLTASTSGEEIQQQLQQALAPHFRYPRLARKRGWQGTVELGLHIATDGRLSNIHIQHSSGHRVLDRAALKSLQKLEKLPGSWEWLKEGRNETLPVRYALIDG